MQVLYWVFLGTVVANPNSVDAPSIRMQFKEYSSSPIIYPTLEKVLELASTEMKNVRYN